MPCESIGKGDSQSCDEYVPIIDATGTISVSTRYYCAAAIGQIFTIVAVKALQIALYRCAIIKLGVIGGYYT